MYFPKIDTLFDRGDNFKVDTNKYRRPEFKQIDRWFVMEKLDGSNISIIADKDGTRWRGRTDKSQFILEVVNHLSLRCESWNNALSKVLSERKLDSIEFFGEVYGPKIQSGGIYRRDIGTKFYDVRVNGSIWLPHHSIVDYSQELEFDIPQFGFNDTWAILDYVREGFPTFETDGDGGTAEGIIAKTEFPLYMNNGERLIWKLKHFDFI